MAQFEGNSSFAFCCRSANIDRYIPRDNDGAATPAELRILRQGPAAECCGRADLFLRMHVLRGLRGDQAAQCLPELRRRVCAAADPACDRTAAPRVRDEAAAVGQARAFEIQRGRCPGALRAAAGHPTAGAVTYPRHCERSEAIHTSLAAQWIASSLRSSQ